MRNPLRMRLVTISIPDEVNFLSRPIRVDSYVEHVVSSKDHRRMNKVSTTCLLNDSAHVAGLLNDSAHVAAKAGKYGPLNVSKAVTATYSLIDWIDSSFLEPEDYASAFVEEFSSSLSSSDGSNVVNLMLHFDVVSSGIYCSETGKGSGKYFDG
ncbi:hypothetical protein FXO38_34340 [Capsicum annuum]|nr:hypothetical protein FXO38_34340 [Capsicum annuum]KAF3617304.1 hypothetical protein FXO37_34691 [Capsicum annuum]